MNLNIERRNEWTYEVMRMWDGVNWEREREIYIICPVNFSSVYYRALKLWKKENQSIYNNNFNNLLNVKRRNLHFKRCSMENETFEIYLFV